MDIQPGIFVAIGDVFLNLSAAWFGLAFITPLAHTRTLPENIQYVAYNIIMGVAALAIGYKFRILGV